MGASRNFWSLAIVWTVLSSLAFAGGVTAQTDDCNNNLIPDVNEITDQTDCNLNGILDACEPVVDRLLLTAAGMPEEAGGALDTDGATIVIGAGHDATNGEDAGAALVFSRDGTQWLEAARLFSPTAGPLQEYGASAAVQGQWLAVGAPGTNQGIVLAVGEVFVYQRLGTTWTLAQRLESPVLIEEAGFGLSIDFNSQGTRMIIGSEGRAFTYTTDGTTWTLDAGLLPFVVGEDDGFGASVCIDGDLAVVGAPETLGLGGLPMSGAAYTFEVNAGNWIETGRLTALGQEINAHYGAAVSLSGNRIAIGEPGRGNGAGAVHTYEHLAGAWALDTSLASPAPGLNNAYGAAVSVLGDSLLVGEPRDPNDRGRVHHYDNSGGLWTLRLSRPDPLVGPQDLYGAGVALSEQTCVVGDPEESEILVHWTPRILDCDNNGSEDICDVTLGVVPDCNLNSIPDSCDIASGFASDCNMNGVPDSCELELDPTLDCNMNAVIDSCDLASMTSLDCNLNLIPDECDTVAGGFSLDCNMNQIPDECEVNPDPIFPTISGLPTSQNLTAEAGTCQAMFSWADPTATDNCGVASLTGSHTSGSSFLQGSTTVTYTATDVSGNVSTASFTITVTDNEPPAISGVLLDQVLSTDLGMCTAIATWTEPTAIDNCGLQSLTSDHAADSAFPLGTTTVTYTATDTSGNTSQTSFTVTVNDTENPVISGLSGDISVNNAQGLCSSNVTWTAPSSSDNCPGVMLTTSHLPGTTFDVGTTLVTYTAMDANGNSSTGSFNVEVIDAEHPQINGLPSGLSVGADPGICAASVMWSAPSTQDNCMVASTSSNYEPGAIFPVGITEVTYVVSDVAGNQTLASFMVEVSDLQNPIVETTTDNVSVTNELGQCSSAASWTPPTFIDNCEVGVVTSDALPGDTFPVGETTVTYTATDIHGNASSTSFTVTVTDNENPTLSSLPLDITQGTDLGNCSAIVTWADPTASDNCGIDSTTPSQASGTSFPLGTTTVQYMTTDIHGNSASASFTVTIIDNENPMWSDIPTDITVNTDLGVCGALVDWSGPLATDNCNVAGTSSTHQPGDLFPVGTTVVSYLANDDAGNSARASFSVTVADMEAPSLTPSGPVTASADSGTCTATVTVPAPMTSDNCQTATLTNDYTGTDDASGMYAYPSTLITWTLTDIYGNSSTATQTVTIEVPQDDCNMNGSPDVCDIAAGNSPDCNGNGVPDECDVAIGGDCNMNGVPDSCDIASGTSLDCNQNGVPDTCDVITLGDCNMNGVPDSCDIESGTTADCNTNGIPDSCDIASGSSSDADGNLTPDECQPQFRRADANGDNAIDIADGIYILLYLFDGGPIGPCESGMDANDDGTVDVTDAVAVFIYQFEDGAPPPPPFENCGVDPTGVALSCETGTCE